MRLWSDENKFGRTKGLFLNLLISLQFFVCYRRWSTSPQSFCIGCLEILFSIQSSRICVQLLIFCSNPSKFSRTKMHEAQNQRGPKLQAHKSLTASLPSISKRHIRSAGSKRTGYVVYRSFFYALQCSGLSSVGFTH